MTPAPPFLVKIYATLGVNYTKDDGSWTHLSLNLNSELGFNLAMHDAKHHLCDFRIQQFLIWRIPENIGPQCNWENVEAMFVLPVQ
jgi:hypothetical protein